MTRGSSVACDAQAAPAYDAANCRGSCRGSAACPRSASPSPASVRSAACWRASSPTACRASRSPARRCAITPRRRPGSTPSGIACPLVELRGFSGSRRPRGRMRAGRRCSKRICRPMLEAGKQRHGALRRRAAAAARAGRTGEGSWRSDHRADRRAARPRRGHRRGRRRDPFGADGDAQAARRPCRRALSRSETASRSRGSTTPKRVFAGTARDGAAGFPANVNVAAALSLAGIGPDRTMMEIWADPTIERNCHAIEVDSDSARFTLYDREYPVGEPEDRPDHGPVGAGGPAEARTRPCGLELRLTRYSFSARALGPR